MVSFKLYVRHFVMTREFLPRTAPFIRANMTSRVKKIHVTFPSAIYRTYKSYSVTHLYLPLHGDPEVLGNGRCIDLVIISCS